ncbi:MAG: hypothetical protein QOF33_5047 [Thermomicrobiales bacterium]|jgi:hypothetical protein|nr:hypothetical protein [Thermomicrobiales bacterium]
MKILISWSGELSHEVGLAIHKHLRLFLHNTLPWISSEDIAKGTLWRLELGKALEAGSVGIFCITRDNVGSPWVNFEAGALSNQQDTARVIPFLFEMRHADLSGPLEDLQASAFTRGLAKNKEEFRKLLESINELDPVAQVPKPVFETTFEKMWPDLEREFNEIAERAEAPGVVVPKKIHDAAQALDEVVEAVRDQRRMLGNALGDERWTFRGNAKLDPLSYSEYRSIALGLGMLKTLAEIESKEYAWPTGGAVATLYMLRDPLEGVYEALWRTSLRNMVPPNAA